MIDDEILLHLTEAPNPIRNATDFVRRSDSAIIAYIDNYNAWHKKLNKLLEDTDAGVGQWSVQYRQHCVRFCENMELSERIKHHLLGLADLTRNGPGKRLRPAGFKDEKPPYPFFIVVVEQIVTGKRHVGQLGAKSKQQLSVALVRYYKGDVPTKGGAFG